jgi:hypothetical protein
MRANHAGPQQGEEDAADQGVAQRDGRGGRPPVDGRVAQGLRHVPPVQGRFRVSVVSVSNVGFVGFVGFISSTSRGGRSAVYMVASLEGSVMHHLFKPINQSINQSMHACMNE